MIEELRKIDELTGALKSRCRLGTATVEVGYAMDLREVLNGAKDGASVSLSLANKRFLTALCEFNDYWEEWINEWKKAFTDEVSRALRISSPDNLSHAHEILIGEFLRWSGPYMEVGVMGGAKSIDGYWASFGMTVASRVHRANPDATDDHKALLVAAILEAKIRSFERPQSGDWGRAESEIAAAIRFHVLHPDTASGHAADTKTDNPKKPRKKREANAAASVCAHYVKKELTQDSTANRRQLVKDWIESKHGLWGGKELSLSGIERMLQDNPELWKPDDT